MQLELERGDDAAAVERLEQLRIAVGAHDLAVGGHDLDRGDAARGEPVAAGEPAHAVAEHVADDAAAAREAAGRGEAEERGAVRDVGPAGARPDASTVRPRVDLHARQRVGPQQHRVVERAEPGGAVAAALRDDAQAGGPRMTDRGRDVALVERERDQRRALVDGEVECPPGGVPADARRAPAARGTWWRVHPSR